jgi:uncharacterized radical SAM superfamily protein
MRYRAVINQVDALDGLELDDCLIKEIEQNSYRQALTVKPPLTFHVPTFKHFESSEISSCDNKLWPAISVTGGDCALQCDHCKAEILKPMIPARTPDTLWRLANELAEQGARGFLLTGGSNHFNEVVYDEYLSTIRRIKDSLPDFKLVVHTALVDSNAARGLEQAGVDVAMLDIIGCQDTITQVYHLKRSVEDFERALEVLTSTGMKVVPHIVIGLHYGKFLGEWNALQIIRRHPPDALVLVVAMPFYANPCRPFSVPDSHEVGRFFLDARKALPEIPLLLGCARPPGIPRVQLDSYAVLAGFDGIAHPSDGIVELAVRLQRNVRVKASCCSIAGDEVIDSLGDTLLELDPEMVIAAEQRRVSSAGAPISRLGAIPVVSEPLWKTAQSQ